MSIKCGHCKETHGSVAEVRACSVASKKSGWSESPFPAPAEFGEPSDYAQGVRSQTVTDARERMFGSENSAATQTAPSREKKRAAEGMYRKAGTIYKVQKAVHGSGQNYAKRLVETLTLDKNGNRKWKFEYAPGFVFELRKEHMLTLEQAKEFGALYGTCCVCGRTLTKEESIAAGIGPICAEKF